MCKYIHAYIHTYIHKLTYIHTYIHTYILMTVLCPRLESTSRLIGPFQCRTIRIVPGSVLVLYVRTVYGLWIVNELFIEKEVSRK